FIHQIVNFSFCLRQEYSFINDDLLCLMKHLASLSRICLCLRTIQQFVNFCICVVAVVISTVRLEQFKVAVSIVIVRSPAAPCDLEVSGAVTGQNLCICDLLDLNIDAKSLGPHFLNNLSLLLSAL